MRTFFFEWQDFEALVAENAHMHFGDKAEFTDEVFSLGKVNGHEAISIFVDSRISDLDLLALKEKGVKLITLRCAGFNMLNVEKAKELGIKVTRVASYSPESIAEFVFSLILTLARKLPRQREAHQKGDQKRTVADMGFTLRGKTLGLHGLGKIGKEVADIASLGFKMQVVFYDPFISQDQIDEYTSPRKGVYKKVDTVAALYKQANIVSIHVPLMDTTANSVNAELLSLVTENFMLINSARGGIVHTEDMLNAIKSGKVQYFGTDVWGAEDKFQKELLAENTVQTNHVAFFTEEAVHSIVAQTLESLSDQARPENILA